MMSLLGPWRESSLLPDPAVPVDDLLSLDEDPDFNSFLMALQDEASESLENPVSSPRSSAVQEARKQFHSSDTWSGNCDGRSDGSAQEHVNTSVARRKGDSPFMSLHAQDHCKRLESELSEARAQLRAALLQNDQLRRQLYMRTPSSRNSHTAISSREGAENLDVMAGCATAESHDSAGGGSRGPLCAPLPMPSGLTRGPPHLRISNVQREATNKARFTAAAAMAAQQPLQRLVQGLPTRGSVATPVAEARSSNAHGGCSSLPSSDDAMAASVDEFSASACGSPDVPLGHTEVIWHCNQSAPHGDKWTAAEIRALSLGKRVRQLGSVSPQKTRRGPGALRIPGMRTTQLASLPTAAVLLLTAFACLCLLSGSVVWPEAAPRPRLDTTHATPLTDAQYDTAEAARTRRALLSALPAVVPADDANVAWGQQVPLSLLPAPAFVCNHTTCAALQAGSEETLPRLLQSPQAAAQGAVDSLLLTTVRQHTLSEEGTGARLIRSPSAHSGRCPSTGAGNFVCGNDVGDALLAAGLMAPGRCRVVHSVRRSGGVHPNSAWSSHVREADVHGPAKKDDTALALVPHSGHVSDSVVKSSQEVEKMYGSLVPLNIGGRLARGNGEGPIGGVSVMFPAKPREDGEQGVLTTLQHVYILFTGQHESSLYVCDLEKPIYV